MARPTETVDHRFWEGDGRKNVEPMQQFSLGGRSMGVTRSQARRIIDNFLACGTSTHSGMRATLWVVLAYCHLEGVEYRLHHYRGGVIVMLPGKEMTDGN